MSLQPVSGSVLSDITTWVRRIIKSPSATAISDAVIDDYINRFYVYDVPERIQLFELRRQYTFETIPNTFIYQFPYQNYQGVKSPTYCDGVEIGLFTSNEQFYKIFPELVLNEQPLFGNGTGGPYSIQLGRVPILNGFIDDLGNLLPYVYITALNSNNAPIYVVDDGSGNLIQTDKTFQQNSTGTGPAPIVGSVNYISGAISFTLPTDIIPGTNVIQTQTSPYSAGVPRIMLFFNNTIKLYPVPDRFYKIQADAYITPAQFLTTNAAVNFAYMSEYLARGAARKILSDQGDMEQMQFYEPLFREQENLVLRRTSRINLIQRTPTIFASQTSSNPYIYSQY